jgi:hypothetical protein
MDKGLLKNFVREHNAGLAAVGKPPVSLAEYKRILRAGYARLGMR